MLKTALVTGAGRRIGRAIAMGLAADGWSVAVHTRAAGAEGVAVAAAVQAAGGRAALVHADLAIESEVEGLVARASEQLGGPLTLLTDGSDIYARTTDGRFFNLLKDPKQPLLVIGGEERFKKLASRARPRKKKKRAPVATPR